MDGETLLPGDPDRFVERRHTLTGQRHPGGLFQPRQLQSHAARGVPQIRIIGTIYPAT